MIFLMKFALSYFSSYRAFTLVRETESSPAICLASSPVPSTKTTYSAFPCVPNGFVGTTVVHDCARGIRSRLEYGPVGLADAGQLTACDDYALVVDYADGAVKLFFHLIDKALEQFV